MARSMVSIGIDASRAFWNIVRSVGLASGSPPPSRAATSTWRISLANSLPRGLVLRALLVLDRRPLGMTGHGVQTSFQEETVDAIVVGELGMERRRERRGRAAPARACRRRAASTSTPRPARSTTGARMNTAWNGAPSSPPPRGRSRSCRPAGRTRCGGRRCRARRSCADRHGRRARSWPAGSCPRTCRARAGRRAAARRSGRAGPTSRAASTWSSTRRPG